MQGKWAVLGVALGALYWLLESALDYTLLGKGSFAFHVFYPDTNEAWMRMTVVLLLVALVCYMGFALDRHRKNQEALEKEKKFSQAIINSIVDPMTVIAVSDYRLLEANQAFLDFVGRSRREVIGRPCYQAVRNRDEPCANDQLFCPLQDTDLSSGSAVIEHVFQRDDGGELVLEKSISPLTDEEGNIVQVIQLSRDVTQRKLAQEELKREKEFREIIFDSIPDAISIIDAETYTIVEVNQAFLDEVGCRRQEVIGKTCFQVTHHRSQPCNSSDHPCPLKRGSLDQSTFVEHIHRGENNEKLHVEIACHPFTSKDGRSTQFVHISRDITKRKKLETQLNLAQKMEAVGRLAGGVAHDFNNILSAILGYCQLALQKLEPEDSLARDLAQIEKAGKRAATLTRQLLAFSRRQVLEPRVIDLNQVVLGMKDMLGRMIGEDIELKTFLDRELGMVKADPGQIEQVIANLAVNARDAMPGGGGLSIETANVFLDAAYTAQQQDCEPGPYAMLAVSDTGTGIDKDVLPQVFEPFFTTKETGKGTGLGLAIVYGIVKQSGGNIQVYSEKGQGTTFKIYLPRVEEEADSIRPESSPVTGMPGGSETILLVEDDEVVRDLVYRILSDGGYRVLVAPDGEAAMALCREQGGSIDLLLSDMVLPKQSGHEIAGLMLDQYPGLKVLFMSGYTENLEMEYGALGQGTNFLAKPFSVMGLLAKVRQVLDG